jgi:hypothetical protein
MRQLARPSGETARIVRWNLTGAPNTLRNVVGLETQQDGGVVINLAAYAPVKTSSNFA